MQSIIAGIKAKQLSHRKKQAYQQTKINPFVDSALQKIDCAFLPFFMKMSFTDTSTVFLLSVTGQISSGSFLPEMDDLVS